MNKNEIIKQINLINNRIEQINYELIEANKKITLSLNIELEQLENKVKELKALFSGEL